MSTTETMSLSTSLSFRTSLGLLGVVCVVAGIRLYRRRPRVPPNLPILKISTLSGNLGVAADIKAYMQNGSEVMQHGYNQVRCSSNFCIEGNKRWQPSNWCRQYSRKGQNYLMRTSQGLVFVAAPNFIEEIRTAPSNILSNMIINNRTLQVKYTLHHILEHDWYEFEVVQKQLTQCLGIDKLGIYCFRSIAPG